MPRPSTIKIIVPECKAAEAVSAAKMLAPRHVRQAQPGFLAADLFYVRNPLRQNLQEWVPAFWKRLSAAGKAQHAASLHYVDEDFPTVWVRCETERGPAGARANPDGTVTLLLRAKQREARAALVEFLAASFAQTPSASECAFPFCCKVAFRNREEDSWEVAKAVGAKNTAAALAEINAQRPAGTAGPLVSLWFELGAEDPGHFQFLYKEKTFRTKELLNEKGVGVLWGKR